MAKAEVTSKVRKTAAKEADVSFEKRRAHARVCTDWSEPENACVGHVCGCGKRYIGDFTCGECREQAAESLHDPMLMSKDAEVDGHLNRV